MYVVILMKDEDSKPKLFGPFRTKKNAVLFIKKKKYSKSTVRTVPLASIK